VLVRRTASPAHADFGGLSSLAALVVVRLDIVSFPRVALAAAIFFGAVFPLRLGVQGVYLL
jgi:hypothetical protein